MAYSKNAFKLRAADAPVIQTAEFLRLYCPNLLYRLEKEDLLIPKAIIIRGNAGSGKSSLLRLFETETLVDIYLRRKQLSDQSVLDRLKELEVITDNGIRCIGIYLQCDSSIRDISNVLSGDKGLMLFNTFVDTRIILGFIRSLKILAREKLIDLPPDWLLEPLPINEAPPKLFGSLATLEEIENKCLRVEEDFAIYLNSFPGEPIPASIQPHARIYSLPYISRQLASFRSLKNYRVLIMLDDLHELYSVQREHVCKEFGRRVGVIRWLATRNEYFDLEDLLQLGRKDGRDSKEIILERLFKAKDFIKFAQNVAERRLKQTESLSSLDAQDFKRMLEIKDYDIEQKMGVKAFKTITKKLKERVGGEFVLPTNISFDELLSMECELILSERQKKVTQASLFAVEHTVSTEYDSGLREAATLFLSKRLKMPYYYGFDMLSEAANQNIEQFLSVASTIVDKMIYKADLGRVPELSPKEQETLIKEKAKAYYESLYRDYNRGIAIRQLVDNLGQLFEALTYSPNASLAPGVNGFGLTDNEMRRLLKDATVLDSSMKDLREILTQAIASNIFTVRQTKQGAKGSPPKTVFYLNRLLCVKYRLPLKYGKWQPLRTDMLVRLSQEAIKAKDILKKVSADTQGPLFEGDEEDETLD